MPSISEARTGWSFDYQTDSSGNVPPGGLVLNNVRHSLHNLARDIRLIGVRLQVQDIEPSGRVAGTRSVFLALAAPTFTVSPINLLLPMPVAAPAPGGRTFDYLRETDEALQFRTYFQNSAGNYLALGLRADYTLPADYFTANFPNCDQQSLTISQRFLFSPRSNSPPHEPSGGLYAARLHPIVKFEFTPNAAHQPRERHTRIESIRFDYRLHLVLDRHYDPAVSGVLPHLGNQAGLFRDRESAAVVAGALELFSSASTSAAFSRSAFEAVEKPLVLEVATTGLAKGFSVFSMAGRGRICWDNVHWWGVRGTGTYISAPGAFHAAHIHWRWGAAGSNLRGSIPEIDTSGVPAPAQANPQAGGIRGALVDPDAWIQTIRVAIVRNEPSLDPTRPNVSLESLCREQWSTLFTTLPRRPQDIFAGDDLVFWYSSEVHRSTAIPAYGGMPATTYTAGQRGSVFVHGLFFAHEPEMTGAQVGSTAAQHWPKSLATIRTAADWGRTAE